MRCPSYPIWIRIHDCFLTTKQFEERFVSSIDVGNEGPIEFGQRPLISIQSNLQLSTPHSGQINLDFSIGLCLNSVINVPDKDFVWSNDNGTKQELRLNWNRTFHNQLRPLSLLIRRLFPAFQRTDDRHELLPLFFLRK